MRKLWWVSLPQAIAQVEKTIKTTTERDLRDAMVIRLARLDQCLAAVRDKWDMPELPLCNES
jgi:hypothetical protein